LLFLPVNNLLLAMGAGNIISGLNVEFYKLIRHLRFFPAHLERILKRVKLFALANVVHSYQKAHIIVGSQRQPELKPISWFEHFYE
jgi:hypothetical protein